MKKIYNECAIHADFETAQLHNSIKTLSQKKSCILNNRKHTIFPKTSTDLTRWKNLTASTFREKKDTRTWAC